MSEDPADSNESTHEEDREPGAVKSEAGESAKRGGETRRNLRPASSSPVERQEKKYSEDETCDF